MDTKLQLYFKEIQCLVEEHLKEFVDDFAEKTEIQILDLAAIQRERFIGKPMAELIRPSFALEIKFVNETFRRQVKYIQADGINVDGDHYNSLRCLVESLDPDMSDRFSLHDYFHYRNIPTQSKGFFPYTDKHSAIQESIVFIDEIKKMLAQNEIKSALFSKEWLDVPLDISMYK